ncbi:MAG: hypothetical protein VZR56_04325 [Treponema sp.]|nr:hypothetical protein [Treponema sp.]
MLVAAAAGIAFAAEANVTARGSMNVVQFESTSGAKPKVFSFDNNNNDHYEWSQGGLKFDFSGEKAGGSLVMDGHDSIIESMTVWCKPLDVLKLTIGDQNVCTNVESIDWSKLYNVDTKGFAVTLSPVEGFNLDLVFGKDGYGDWLNNGDLARILAKASYSADFGTASVVFGYKGDSHGFMNGATALDDVEYGYYRDGDTWKYGIVNEESNTYAGDDVEYKSKKDSELVFGAGFSGNAGPVSFFADVAATIAPQADKAFSSVGFDAFATFAQDALTAKAYVKANIKPNASGKAKTDVGFKLKGEYSLGDVTPYVVISSDDLIIDDGDIGLKIKPGFTANVGECAIDVAVEAKIKQARSVDNDTRVVTPAKAFTVGIPVSFKVSF